MVIPFRIALRSVMLVLIAVFVIAFLAHSASATYDGKYLDKHSDKCLDKWADKPVKKIDVEPIKFHLAQVIVSNKNSETHYNQTALEELGVYRMTSKTPWRDEETIFEGVMLHDLLAEHGLENEHEIKIVAENDYAVTLPQKAWMCAAAMIATRVDGQAHKRRARGPLQIVFPMSANAEYGKQDYLRYWVWMLARIEPLDE